MNLNDAKQLARQLMDEHGANNVPLVISNGKTQLGVCTWKANPNNKTVSIDLLNQMLGMRRSRQSKKARFEGATCKHIKLSRYLVNLNDETEVKQTMLHEIAHFLVGPTHGHDAVWRRKAIEIGCNGQRLNKTADMPNGRYKAVCQCGKVFYKHRKGKNVLRSNWWRCKPCGRTIQFVDTLARASA